MRVALSCASARAALHPSRQQAWRTLRQQQRTTTRSNLAASPPPPPARARASAAAVSGASASEQQPSPKEAHNAFQAAFFDAEVEGLRASITPSVEARLARIAAAIPGLGPESRVLDAGAGEGAMVPHLQARSVSDILAVDVSPGMLAALEARVGGAASTLGNEPGVRTWLGDVCELPSYQGPFDVAVFNAVFGNLVDQREALLRTCFLMRPGGYVVVSHPLGRPWHERFRAAQPQLVPSPLPTAEQLAALVGNLPLRVVSVADEPDCYVALLQVPEGYAHPAAPIRLSGAVATGYGRGSRQLGVPTANLPPEPLAAQLAGLPDGVYFGWAQLDVGADWPAADRAVHKMVMNVGKAPTFKDAEPKLSVEAHIMHKYSRDFYGQPLRVLALGYIRPEMKFGGLPELLTRINADIGLARSQLDAPRWAEYAAVLAAEAPSSSAQQQQQQGQGQ